jgi:YD repeat-containing protein
MIKRTGMMLFWLGMVTVQVAAQTADRPAAGQTDTPTRELADERWTDQAYGLSLRPPIGTRLVQDATDEYLLRVIDDENRFAIGLKISEAGQQMSLQQIVETAEKQIREAQELTRTISKRITELAGRDAAIVYFQGPNAAGLPWLIGQAIVPIDGRNYAIIEIRCLYQFAGSYRPVFEAVLGSLQIADQRELARQRAQAIERGEQWLRSITIKDRHAALVDQQYYRVIENRRDVGYIRIRQAAEDRPVAGESQHGIEVEIRMRMREGRLIADTSASMFLSDDQFTEIWEITTTYRRPLAPEDEVAQRTFVESGLRRGNRIEVRLARANEDETQTYERPAQGYLSLVDAQLIGQLLPRDRAGRYGFYWFNRQSATMTFRTDQVIPALSGYRLITRSAPNARPISSAYDADGNLLERNLTDGRRMIATDPQTILQIWQER